MILLKRISLWWQSRKCFVVIDPADNSVTLSEHLFAHLRKHAPSDDSTKVFMFKTSHQHYGFMFAPTFEQETQLCDIQFNTKHRTVGFETLCPSVGAICYDYNLSADKPTRLRVKICYAGDKMYYQFCKP